MQKTRLGISVGLFGAALFFTCFFGGYVAAFLLAGYVLLFEENAWLRKAVVRGIALMIGFSLLYALVNLIPDALGFIGDIAVLFNGSFNYIVISNIVSVLTSALIIAEKVLFIALGVKALTQGTIKLPVIDALVDKYMD